MFIQYEKNGINCILNLGHVSAVQHEKGSNKITLLGGIIMKGEQEGTQIFGHCIIDEITFQDFEVFEGVITGEERAAKFMSRISGKVSAIEEQAVVPQRTIPKPPPPPPPRPQSEPEKRKTEHRYWPMHPLYMLISIVSFLLIIFGIIALISK